MDLSPVSDHLMLDPFQQLVGVRIDNGVDEMSVAAALEVIGSSLDRSTVISGNPVQSKRGLTLVAAQTDEGAADRSVAVPTTTGFAYDAVLKAEAERAGSHRALQAARSLNYPADQLGLEATRARWNFWKIAADGLLGLAIAWWLLNARRRAVRARRSSSTATSHSRRVGRNRLDHVIAADCGATSRDSSSLPAARSPDRGRVNPGQPTFWR
jgi:hypothetical protein